MTAELKTFRLTCSEEATVNYYVQADTEEEAREALMAGDYDDYNTLGGDILEITAVEELT